MIHLSAKKIQKDELKETEEKNLKQMINDLYSFYSDAFQLQK